MAINLAETRLASVTGHLVPVSSKTAWIFLEVALADGTIGFGEATSFGAERAVLAEIDLLAGAVARHRPEPIGPALSLLSGQQVSSARRAVSHALEQALFDALSFRCGLPLCTFLGGPYRSIVPVYANINRGITDRTPQGFARQAAAIAREEGYRAIKIAPFDGYRWQHIGGSEARALIQLGIERVLAVRDAVGAGVDILVDCHGRFDPAGANLVLKELEPAGLFWLEEPIDDKIFDSFSQRMVRTAAHSNGTRIAGGEQLETLHATSELIAAGGCDVFLPDLRSTGIRLGLSILELAVASGVSASLHNPVGPVLDAISRHVAAAMPDFLILERQVRETPLYDQLRGGEVALRDGTADIEMSGGLGFSIDRKTLIESASVLFEPTASFVGMAGAGGDA